MSLTASKPEWAGRRRTCLLLITVLAGGVLLHPAMGRHGYLGGADRADERPVARWFLPGTLGMEKGEIAPLPGEQAFVSRSLWGLGDGESGQWAQDNQLTEQVRVSHSIHRLVPVSVFEENPEFFPEIRGERWQPVAGGRNDHWQVDFGEAGVARFVAGQVADQLSRGKAGEVVSIGTNDAVNFGDSAATRHWVYPPRWFRGNPNYSDLVFQFSNAVAKHLEEEWPEVYLGQLAYYWTEPPPAFPLHPAVMPVLATDQSHLYDPVYRQQEWMLLSGWGASGAKRIGLIHYLYGGTGFVVPRLHISLIAEHLRRARQEGFTDYRAATRFNWGLEGPQPWVVAQLLVDPFAEVDGLLDEYYRRYFRRAAEPMRQFFAGCEAVWLNQPGPPYWLKHFTNESQADLFSPEVCAALREHLLEAARLAAGDPKTVARVELVSEAFTVVEAFSRFHQARLALSEALMAGLDETEPEKVRKLLEEYYSALEGAGDRGQPPAQRGLRPGGESGDRGQESGVRGQESGDRGQEAGDRGQEAGRWERCGTGGPGRGGVWQWREYREDERVRFPEFDGFLPTLERVRDEYPLAFAPVRLAYFLVNDPGPTAAALLDGLAGAVVKDSRLSFEGPREEGLEMAGLTFQIPTPPGWISLVEPFENYRAEWLEQAGETVLRLETQKQFDLQKWLHWPHGKKGLASIEARGQLSPSAFFMLRANWFGADGQPIGESIGVRLHDGEHPEWKPLRLLLDPPKAAQWVRYRLTAYFMQEVDWLEVRQSRVRGVVGDR